MTGRGPRPSTPSSGRHLDFPRSGLRLVAALVLIGSVLAACTHSSPQTGPGGTVLGGTGPTCQGRAATLVGRAGGDGLSGGPGDDRRSGGPGDDVPYGEKGNDVMNAGSDNDVLVGDPDNDVLQGGPGDDRMYGGEDNDRLSGASGNDLLD